MVHGAFEWDVWECRRIVGVVSRLVLLPLIIDWIIFFWVVLSLDENYHKIGLISSISGLGFFWKIVGHAILMPYIAKLKRMDYDEEKNIITLLVATSWIVEVITSITDGFIIYMFKDHITLNYDQVTTLLPKYCIDVITEIIFGIMYGLLMIFVPLHKLQNLCNLWRQERNENFKTYNVGQITVIRVFLLCVGGFLIMLYKWYTDFPLISSLGCALTCFVANSGWKWRDRKDRRENSMISNSDDMDIQNQINVITKLLEVAFTMLCPMVFGIFGIYFLSAVIDKINDIANVLICLLITYTINIIFTTLLIRGYGFNLKEIVFINIWCFVCSSGTVLYSTICYLISATSLRMNYDPSKVSLVVTMASIILRAMLGHFVIHWFGVRLLKKANCPT